MQRIKPYLALFIIVCIGAYFRFQGIGYDLPNSYNPDDVYTVENAVAVADGNIKQGNSIHGSLHNYIIAWTLRILKRIHPALFQGYSTFTDAYNTNRSVLFVTARTVNALFSTATIFVLFLLAQSLFGNLTAIFSVLTMSMNILEIQYAHELYADTPLMFLTTLTIYLLARSYRHSSLRIFTIATISLIAALTQKSTALLLVPISIVTYISIIKDNTKSANHQVFRYAIPALAVIILVSIYSPVLMELLHWLRTNKWLTVAPYQDPLILLNTNYTENLIAFIVRMREGMGSLPMLMSVTGIFIAFRSQNRFSVLLAGFIPWYLMVVAIVPAYWDVIVLPLFPVLSLFAGLSSYTVFRFVQRITLHSLGGLLLIGIMLLPALAKSYAMSRSYTIPDTRTHEALWFKNNAIDSSRIARDILTSVALPAIDNSTSMLSRKQLETFDYIVLSSWYSTHFSESWRKTASLAATYEDIRQTYDKVAEFQPAVSDIFIDDLELLTNRNAWKRLSYIRGPTITIYRKPNPAEDLHR